MCSGNRAPGDHERCSVRELPSRCVPTSALHSSVLKSPLETPEPHVRGKASMLHTIELITETCHGVPSCSWGLEASLVKGVAGLTQPVSHCGLCHTKNSKVVNKMVGTRCIFLSVSSGENGRQSAIMHDLGSRGPQTTRHDFFVGHLFEEKAP